MHEMTNPTVMNMDLHLLRERLRQDPNYRQLCQAAGAEDCTPELAEAALVAFIETLRPALTPFDTGVISDAAERGQKLFEGKARCSSCHAGPQMSDGRPHNTGVPENLDIFRDPVRHLTYIAVLEGLGVPGATQWRRDVGYYVISRRVSDIGKFITPPLRELKYTAPYMHNGTLKSLAAVVEYYDQGGGRDDPLPNELTPLNLSPQEKRDIVAFLESLSSATPMAIADIDIPQSYPALRVESAED